MSHFEDWPDEPNNAFAFLPHADLRRDPLLQFADRVRAFEQFVLRERGAYGLFVRIARATCRNGDRPSYDFRPATSPTDADTMIISFPLITHQTPTNDPHLIRLRTNYFTRQNRVVAVVPWLEVYPPEITAEDLNVDVAEEVFVRHDIAFMFGRRDPGETMEFYRAMLGDTPEAVSLAQENTTTQDNYIEWLRRVAVAVGVNPMFYDDFPLPVNKNPGAHN